MLTANQQKTNKGALPNITYILNVPSENGGYLLPGLMFWDKKIILIHKKHVF